MATEKSIIKRCTKCGETKSLTEFHKDARKPDGLRCECKACAKIVRAKWHAANPEKDRARTAKWRAKNPEKHKAYAIEYRRANPERVKAARAKRYAANSDKARAGAVKYYAANIEKRREYAVEYRSKNPEKVRAAAAKYRAANPEKRCIYEHNRRARKLADGGKLSVDIAERLFKLQRGKCPCCRKPLGDDYHRDHRMPLALGGTNTDDNIQLLCAKCNMQKHTAHPIEFMQQRGFLL